MNEIVFKGVLILALFTLSMGVAAYSTWAERKVAALLQDRIGPNRAGWRKVFFQRRFYSERGG